ncbi:MAG: hypothetical protein Kow0077_19250 [Anaerolineae bacterium]
MSQLTPEEAYAALEAVDPSERRRGAEALGVLAEMGLIPGRETATLALLERLGDAYPDVRGAVVSALGQLAPRLSNAALTGRTAARLVTALDDADPSVRVAAARAVGHFGARTGDPALRQAVVMEGLVTALDDFDGMVRREVVAALEMVMTEAAAEALQAVVSQVLGAVLVEEGDRLVRYYIVRALSRIGAGLPAQHEARAQIVAALQAAAADSDAVVARSASRALEALQQG